MSHRQPRFGPIALAACFVASSLSARPVTVVTETCPAIDLPALPSQGAAIRVFIDPVTGKTRPATAEERRKAAEAAATYRDRSARIYEMEIRPDGTRIVPLDDAFRMNLVATVHPDGTVTYGCGPGQTAGTAREASK